VRAKRRGEIDRERETGKREGEREERERDRKEGGRERGERERERERRGRDALLALDAGGLPRLMRVWPNHENAL
jgi:hypothetical protein